VGANRDSGSSAVIPVEDDESETGWLVGYSTDK
jgi:hypothetical protein